MASRSRPAVTGRALVLGAVMVLLLVLLAAPLNRYFASRGDVTDAAVQLQQDRAKLTELTKQRELWGDPAYVKAQARKTLQYAMPGDTSYIVVDRGARNQIDRTTDTPASTSSNGNWNTRLWTSVERAGAAAG